MKRCMLYVFTYILMTLTVAFGTVTIDDLTSKSNNKGGSSDTVISKNEIASVGDKFLNNLMTIGGAELNLDVDIFDKNKVKSKTLNDIVPDINILFNGNLNIASIENITADGNIKLTIDGKEINVYIAFIDNKLYLSNQTLNISKSTDDMSELFDLLPLLGLNLDLGIEINENILDDLMSSLQNIKETKIDDNNIKLTLNLLDFIYLDIYCDADYNVKNIKSNDIEISNYIITLNAGLNKNENIIIENPENNSDKEYVDITKTLNIIDSVKEIMTNKKLHLNLNADLLDKDLSIGIDGDVDVDFTNSVKAHANLVLNLNGTKHSLKLYYLNSNVYIDLNGIKFKFDKNTIENTIDVITSKFDLTEVEKEILNKIKQIIPDFDLKKILAGSWKDINIDNLLAVSKGEENVVKLKIFGNAINLDYDIELAIALDENDQFSSLTISGIKLLNKDVSIVIKYSNIVNIPKVNDSEFANMTNLPNLVDAIINTVKDISANKIVMLDLNTTITIKNKIVDLNGSIKVDFNDKNNLKIYSHLNVEILNKIIVVDIYFKDNVLYLSMNNLKFKSNIDELNLLVKQIESVVKDSTISNLVDGLKEVLYGTTVLVKVFNGDISAIPNDIIKDFDISQNLTYICINKNLIGSKEDIKLNIKYSDKIDGISFDTISLKMISCNLDCGFTTGIEFPSINIDDYSNLENISVFVNSFINTIQKINNEKALAFNLQSVIHHKTNKLNDKKVLVSSTENIINILESSSVLINLKDVIKIQNNITNLDINNLQIYLNFDVKLDTIKSFYNNGVLDNSKTQTNTSNHKLELKFINNFIYVKFDKMSIKFSVDGINLVIDSICEMMGLEVNSNSFANLVDIISKLKDGFGSNLSLEMIKNISLSDNSLKIIADLSNLQMFKDLRQIDFGIIYSDKEIEKIFVKNINTSKYSVNNIDISLNNFVEINDYTDKEKQQFLDMSTVGNLTEALKNTMKFKDFNLYGNVQLNLSVIGLSPSFNIPVDAKISLFENGFESEITLGAIPVITGVNNDVPYLAGNTVSNGSPGKNRILKIYIKDNFVYLYRSEYVPVFANPDRLYEKKLMVHIDTFMTNPLEYILKFGIGLSDKIMLAIEKAINFERTTQMDLSNILLGYSLSSNLHMLKLNLKELTGNNQLDTFSLGFKVIDYVKDNSKNSTKYSVIGGITLDMFMPIANGVEITLKSNDLNFKNIGIPCDYKNANSYISKYSYKEGALWDAYNGDWNLSSQRKFTIKFISNSKYDLPNVSGIAGESYSLPILENYDLDDGITHKSYKFLGWYTNENFEPESKYDKNIIPRNDLILYAKWDIVSKKYITISFNTNGGKSIEPLKVLEGSELNLPIYKDFRVEKVSNKTITYQFVNWFQDENFQIPVCKYALNNDYIVYAKWVIVNTEESYIVNVFDNGEKLTSKYFYENDALIFDNSPKFNSTTKYYLDNNLKNELTNFIMPNHNLDLYISNEYSVKISSKYGNVFIKDNKYYQNTIISILNQISYMEDDGTQTKRVNYIFNGYMINGEKILNINEFIIPNRNIEIVADWLVETKLYYVVSFDMSLNYIPYLCAVGCSYKIKPKNFSSVKILDGEVLDLSSYRTTCKIAATAIGLTKYDYVSSTWGTTILKDGKNGGNGFTSVIVTGNLVLYPYWEKI